MTEFFALIAGITSTAFIAYALHVRHCRKRDLELANELSEVREFQRVKNNVLDEIAVNGYTYIEDQNLNLYIVARHPMNGSEMRN